MGKEKTSVFRKIRRVMSTFVHAPALLDAMEKREQALREQLTSLEGRFIPVEEANHDYLTRLTGQLGKDSASLINLNRSLSTCPTVWGDASKLHISPLASVHTCLFNTNSGEIFVGDYSFAGSRVSLLAGSHDKRLTGFLRRDAEYVSGCDIHVGKGVWLGSGCMLLGPCTVEDNAVIAAGAVVVPGTKIPAGTVWGGVPAKEIAKLDMSGMASAVSEALERSGGLLFVSGWSPKVYGLGECPLYQLEEEGIVLTTLSEARLTYWQEQENSLLVISGGNAGGYNFLQEIVLAGKQGEINVEWPNPSGDRIELRFRRKGADSDLGIAGGAVFMAVFSKVGTCVQDKEKAKV